MRTEGIRYLQRIHRHLVKGTENDIVRRTPNGPDEYSCHYADAEAIVYYLIPATTRQFPTRMWRNLEKLRSGGKPDGRIA